ncbi:hypothetical protein Tco_0505813 [Tanacetum coccineum]
MTTLQFADTHNLVVFLAKPAESEGFEQIVDFLNASSIRYALTVNPTIYTSCIEQFWATVMVKTVNGEQQLQALVDGKKIIITEETVRRDLQLKDADGVYCLPNTTIFEHLTLMGVGRSARVVSSEEEGLGDQKDASKQGRIDDIDVDKDIYLVNVHRDEDMFGLNDLEGGEVVLESEVTDRDVNLSIDEVTLAQALAALKSAKVKDKGKGKMVEEEPVKKMSKKELLKLDEELAFNIQAKEDEEERLAREKAQKVKEANIAWDDI